MIYIRQSTRQQLVDHQESTRLQYALVDQAVALGWQADRIVVIEKLCHILFSQVTAA